MKNLIITVILSLSIMGCKNQAYQGSYQEYEGIYKLDKLAVMSRYQHKMKAVGSLLENSAAIQIESYLKAVLDTLEITLIVDGHQLKMISQDHKTYISNYHYKKGIIYSSSPFEEDLELTVEHDRLIIKQNEQLNLVFQKDRSRTI